jgi:hypothetical protein
MHHTHPMIVLSNLFRSVMQYMFEIATLVLSLWQVAQYWVAAVCCHEERSCHFGSLSMLPRADGDLLACEDIGSEHDSMLSLRLIVRNFHRRHGERLCRGNRRKRSGYI